MVNILESSSPYVELPNCFPKMTYRVEHYPVFKNQGLGLSLREL